MLVPSFTIGGTSSAVNATITPSSAQVHERDREPPLHVTVAGGSRVADSATAMNIAMNTHVIGLRSR